jgi:hypothetical protein
MITSLFLLDHGLAAVASLPALFLSLLQDFGNLRIFRAVGRPVHLITAKSADFSPAARAGCEFATLFLVDMGGLNPVPTLWRRTVQAILSVVLLILAVPEGFELYVVQLVNMT